MGIYFLLSHIVFALVITGVSALTTWLMLRHLTIYDVPNERSSHTQITPKGGGIGIVVAFLVGISLLILFKLSSHVSQFSIISSGIRENSFTLPVTRVRPKANAWAAISKSLPPIGVPARSKATLSKA